MAKGKQDDREWMERHFNELKAAAQRVQHIHPDVLEDGPTWALLKHMTIRNLLGMYLTVIGQAPWARSRYFIDTHSSCGLNLLRGTKHVVAGSPLIGATTTTRFDHHFFVERDPHKASVLKDRLSHLLPEERFTVFAKSADEALPEIMDRIPRRDAHYFAVVDPYGITGITWEGFRHVMGHPRGDVLINFQTTIVKRGTPAQAEAFFGSPAIRELIAREASEEEILAHFVERVQTLRPRTETIRVKSGGGNRFYYDLIYAVAETGGGNPWLRMVPPMKARIERLEGEGVFHTLTSGRLDRFGI